MQVISAGMEHRQIGWSRNVNNLKKRLDRYQNWE
jgi:hypothetical protein